VSAARFIHTPEAYVKGDGYKSGYGSSG